MARARLVCRPTQGTGVAMAAEQAADCMCECLRLAALTDDPQIRNQLTQQAQHWMAVSMPALRATRGRPGRSFTQTSMLPGTNARSSFRIRQPRQNTFCASFARVKQQNRVLVCIAPVEFWATMNAFAATLAIHGSRSVSFMSSCSDIQ